MILFLKKMKIFFLAILIIKSCDGNIYSFEANSDCKLDESKIQLICSISIITKLLPIAINFNINNGFNENFLVKTG